MTKNENDLYRIVVGHDLERTGDEALEEAMVLARRMHDSEIHVVHALARPSATDAAANERRLEGALVALRSRAEVVLARDPSLTVHAHVRFGKIVETIIGVAVDHDADLVLVGTHGRRGLDRVRSRSVAERLVRLAPLPVLVAHAKDFALLPLGALPVHERPSDRARTQRVIALGLSANVAGAV